MLKCCMSLRALTFTDLHRGFNDKTASIQDKVFRRLDPNSFDVIILCGDNATTKPKQIESLFKALRKYFPDKIIMTVWGNHDYWDKRNLRLLSKIKKLKELAEKYNIHTLENNPLTIGDYLFLGFNGWYYQDHTDTADQKNIGTWVETGELVDNYLRNEADKAVNFIIDYPKDNKKVITVTHFPCIQEVIDTIQKEYDEERSSFTVSTSVDKTHWNGNPHHGEILLEFSDFIFFGHSHKPYDKMIGKSRVINVGNGYTMGSNYHLKYQIIDFSK